MASDDRIKVAVLVEAGGDERERDALTAKLRRELLRLNVDAVAAASRRSTAARSGKTSTIACAGSCWRCRRFGRKARTSPASGRARPRAAQRAPRGGRARRHATGPPAAAAASMARERAGAGDGSGAGGDLQERRVGHAGRSRSAGAATSGDPEEPRPCHALRCGRGESGAWLAGAGGTADRRGASRSAAPRRHRALPRLSRSRAARAGGPRASSAAPPGRPRASCSVCSPVVLAHGDERRGRMGRRAGLRGRTVVTVRRGRGNLEPSRTMPRLDIVSTT